MHRGVIAVGAILGGALAGVFSKKLKFKAGPLILIGCALSVLIGGIASQTLKAPMAIYVVVAIGEGLLVALSTLFQIQIGKVIACVICVCMCPLPLGQLLYGIVFEKIENSTCLPFYAVTLIMTGISVFTRRIFYGMDTLLSNEK